MKVIVREDGSTIEIVSGYRRLDAVIEVNGEAVVTLPGAEESIIVVRDEQDNLVEKPISIK